MLSLDEVVELQLTPFDGIVDAWERLEAKYGAAIRADLGRVDRFYLLTVLLHRPDACHPWVYERCREVEAAPDDNLDLWAREHFKSSVITFAGSIQEIIRDPEITIGIFSHTKGVARKFLAQIKNELESNDDLRQTFAEVFYAAPKKESPRWSEDGGIVVKRKGNPKEATVEAWGLVDGQPTGAHYKLRVYDDVVTDKSVGTPEQIAKTTERWELSDNLGAKGEDGLSRSWHAGTRYHFGDTYGVILERKALKARIYPATDDGTPTGKPVLLSPEAWAKKKEKQSASVIACQSLLNPVAGSEAMFQRAWLRYAEIRPATLNIYVMVDPASSRKTGTDKTAIAVIAVDAARNKYLVDGYHHKMKLSERWTAIKTLRKHWMRQPGVQGVFVGYERYGADSDMEHFIEKMEQDRDAFEIAELAWPREGPGSKFDRIQRLVPDAQNGRLYLWAKVEGETTQQRRMRETGQAFRIMSEPKRYDHEKKLYSLRANFEIEFCTYPFSAHDDFLDATSRIYDMKYRPPIIIDRQTLEPELYEDGM